MPEKPFAHVVALTPDQWDVVENALSEVAAESYELAAMWVGRRRERESRYRAQGDEVEAIRQAIEKQRGTARA